MSSEVELRNAATDLLSLLRDYMVVTSLTANDRFEEAVERLRVALSASPSIGRVTDSMVEAALRGWYPGWDTEDRPKATDGISRAKMRAALAAALVYHEEPAGDTQGALAVRPLKWEPSGRYPFVAMSDYYDIGHQSGDGRYWVHHRIFGDLREGDGTIEHHLTLDAAKAAAQEDHERKILWQIVGSSDPDVAPPNVEHLRPLADREKSAALVSPPDNGEAVAWRQIIHELAADIRDRLSNEEGSANWRNAQRIVELSRPSAALQSHNEGRDGK